MPNIPTPTIIRSHRSSITLQVTPLGEVIVHAPKLVPKFFIDRFVQEKSDWVAKKILELEKRPRVQKRKYIEGEEFLVLGKSYKLKFTNAISISLADDYLLFPKAISFRIKKELEDWYMRLAKEKITQRLEYQAAKMNAHYKAVYFSDTKSKWGTCMHDNTLQFNWRLIMAPLMVMDYVVIHELTHTTHKNHSDVFWRHVALYTPAYKQHRKWLTTHGQELMI